MRANRREKDKGNSFNRGGKNKRLKSKIKSVQKFFLQRVLSETKMACGAREPKKRLDTEKNF
jgi:hypothetical protein